MLLTDKNPRALTVVRMSKAYDEVTRNSISAETLLNQKKNSGWFEDNHEYCCPICLDSQPEPGICQTHQVAFVQKEQMQDEWRKIMKWAAVAASEKLDVAEIAEMIMEEERFLTMEDTEEIFIYNGGNYIPKGNVRINEYVKRITGERAKRNLVGEVMLQIRSWTYVDRNDFNKDTDLIPMKNGLFSISKRKLLPHSPAHLFTYVLPIGYDEAADCPNFKQFLTEVLGSGDIPKIQEFFGYCLCREYFIHKAFMLTGSGRNGKSVLLAVLKHFLGANNVVGISIQSLGYSNFIASNLYGKLANIYPDLSDKSVTDTGVFKGLTGGDAITCDQKFKAPITFVNYAKFIFSANKLPETQDDSDAFFRRWEIIMFPNTFSEEQGNIKPNLIKTLTTEKELSGIFNWALEGLNRLLCQGCFTNTTDIDKLRETYTTLSDSLVAFVEEATHPDPEGFIPKQRFYAGYVSYCKTRSLPIKTKQKVGGELITVSPDIWGGQRRVGDTRIDVWNGLNVSDVSYFPLLCESIENTSINTVEVDDVTAKTQSSEVKKCQRPLPKVTDKVTDKQLSDDDDLNETINLGGEKE